MSLTADQAAAIEHARALGLPVHSDPAPWHARGHIEHAAAGGRPTGLDNLRRNIELARRRDDPAARRQAAADATRTRLGATDPLTGAEALRALERRAADPAILRW